MVERFQRCKGRTKYVSPNIVRLQKAWITISCTERQSETHLLSIVGTFVLTAGQVEELFHMDDVNDADQEDQEEEDDQDSEDQWPNQEQDHHHQLVPGPGNSTPTNC